jgi:hypothetical protein
LIKLADYSSATLSFIKSNELACLYVFAVNGRQPCKIGHALNLRHRHNMVQGAHPEPITIEYLTWCPSAATAALIAEDVRHKLGSSTGRAGWYNIGIPEAVAVVRKACAQFPSRSIIEHAAFLAQAAAVGFNELAVKHA